MPKNHPTKDAALDVGRLGSVLLRCSQRQKAPKLGVPGILGKHQCHGVVMDPQVQSGDGLEGKISMKRSKTAEGEEKYIEEALQHKVEHAQHTWKTKSGRMFRGRCDKCAMALFR
jgi:hypothetical protein